MTLFRVLFMVIPLLVFPPFAVASGEDIGLQIDGIYVKVDEITQVSLSAKQHYKSRLLSSSSFAEYFKGSNGVEKWKIGASGKLSWIDVGYMTTQGYSQAEIGLSRSFGKIVSVGVLWRGSIEDEWTFYGWPNSSAVFKAEASYTLTRWLPAPLTVYVGDKYVRGESIIRHEWWAEGSFQIKRLLLRVERRWDLSRIGVGIKL